MGRRGPKKKLGNREPNGRLQRYSEARGEAYMPLHHIRRMIALGKLDGRYGTPLGRMVLNERISKGQFDAATRFVDIRRAADAALGLPPRTVPAQTLGELRGHDGDVETEEERRRKTRDLDAWDKLVALLGVQTEWMRAMERIALYELEPDDYSQVIKLVEALNRLMAYWGMRH